MAVEWLKHAFAVDPPRCDPTELQRMLVERLCVELVRRHLAMPARLMLEMCRPLNYVSAQLLHFFQPIVGIIANTGEYEAFARFLEQRGSIDYISLCLEAVEAAGIAGERAGNPGLPHQPPPAPAPAPGAHDGD
jgi:hypothetical protein